MTIADTSGLLALFNRREPSHNSIRQVVDTLTANDIRSCTRIIANYKEQQIGVTDASLVVLADRYGTTDILTLDERHFNVIKPLQRGYFNVLQPTYK